MNNEQFTEDWNSTKVVFIEKESVDFNLPVVAVKCYLIRDKSIIFVKDTSRGWDVPGGHVEKNESPEDAIRRELKEEANCEVNTITLIGYLLCTQSAPNSKYPYQSLIGVYGSVDFFIDHSQKLQNETYDVRLIPLKKVFDYHHNWTTLKDYIVSLVERN